MSYDPIAAGCACQYCPLQGRTVVPPEGNSDALMAFVGETPGFQEEKQERPFIGPSGQKLEELLYHIGLNRRQIWITNVILCRPEVPGLEGKKKYDFPTYLAWIRLQNAQRRREAMTEAKAQKKHLHDIPWTPMASPVDCCSLRLGSELAVLERAAMKRGQPNGAVVVPMGNFALEAITGRKGIMKYRGSVLGARAFPNPDLELDKRADR